MTGILATLSSPPGRGSDRVPERGRQGARRDRGAQEMRRSNFLNDREINVDTSGGERGVGGRAPEEIRRGGASEEGGEWIARS